MSEGTIVAEGLRKVFRTAVRRPGRLGGLTSLVAPQTATTVAVDSLTLRVEPGELLALLGPNGAGKSTAIKMLTGILTPTAGLVRVNGIEPHTNRIENARRVGAVFGQRSQLWRDLPARDSLQVLRDIYGVDAAHYQARLAEFNKILELERFWDTRARQLSLGQRVRCDLAAALLHDPPVVFLDEPTIGMDVVVKKQVREFLRDQAGRRGRTIILTTHDVGEVAKLADRVVLINQGRLIYDGLPGLLGAAVGATWTVRVTVAGPLFPDIAIPGARLLAREGADATLAPASEGTLQPRDLVRWLIERLPVIDISVAEPDLEDIVRAVFAGGQAKVPWSGGQRR